MSIRNTQINFFQGHLAGTSRSSGVSFPCLEKIAAAYDIPYLAVDTRAELPAAVARTLAAEGPVICEVFTPSEQEIIPNVTSVKLESGKMVSKPLQDMYPFIDTERLEQLLRV